MEITYKIDLDLRIKYTEQILRNSAPKKFLHVLLGCKKGIESWLGISGLSE